MDDLQLRLLRRLVDLFEQADRTARERFDDRAAWEARTRAEHALALAMTTLASVVRDGASVYRVEGLRVLVEHDVPDVSGAD